MKKMLAAVTSLLLLCTSFSVSVYAETEIEIPHVEESLNYQRVIEQTGSAGTGEAVFGNWMDSLGTVWNGSLGVSNGGYMVYDITRSHCTRLVGSVLPCSDLKKGAAMTVIISLDGKALYTSGSMGPDSRAESFSIDISNGSQLKIECTAAKRSEGHCIVDAVLENEAQPRQFIAYRALENMDPMKARHEEVFHLDYDESGKIISAVLQEKATLPVDLFPEPMAEAGTYHFEYTDDGKLAAAYLISEANVKTVLARYEYEDLDNDQGKIKYVYRADGSAGEFQTVQIICEPTAGMDEMSLEPKYPGQAELMLIVSGADERKKDFYPDQKTLDELTGVDRPVYESWEQLQTECLKGLSIQSEETLSWELTRVSERNDQGKPVKEIIIDPENQTAEINFCIYQGRQLERRIGIHYGVNDSGVSITDITAKRYEYDEQGYYLCRSISAAESRESGSVVLTAFSGNTMSDYSTIYRYDVKGNLETIEQIECIDGSTFYCTEFKY